MLRLAMAAVTILALVGCAGDESSDPSGGTVEITLWPAGLGEGESSRWTLACEPPGGSLPDPAAACTALASAPDPWAPVPPGTICAQVVAGPEVLEVGGRLLGASVSARYTRTDACEDARYRAISAVLGLPGSA